MLALSAPEAWSATTALPNTPDSYLDQAARVRQAHDRPWVPEQGRLGNLRHLQITARDCVVRIVSGSENRVFPGTREVIVAEQSRVLDANPDEQPTPRDVVLAPDHGQACPGNGSCGVSVTSATGAPRLDGGKVCFTVQIATAHDLLLGGEGLAVLIERVQQPALRIWVNPAGRQRLWLEQVNLGLLSIHANAAADIGGSGKADFLSIDSSMRGSVMYMHDIHARNVGVSSTTTGTHWSIRIGADTRAGYYQPARAPGALAAHYGIEIDGPVERLEQPAGRVDPHPLSDATRQATQALRSEVLALSGTMPRLPAPDPALPAAAAVAAALPQDARRRVAEVVAKYLPATVRITEVALWKQGGRLEGIAPDAATARDVVRLLTNSGEFTYVSGGAGIPRDGGYAFSTQLNFSCAAPGEASVCPAGDPAAAGAYSEAQVRTRLHYLLGPAVGLRQVSLNGSAIVMKAVVLDEAAARAALERIGKDTQLFRLSSSTFGPSNRGSLTDLGATLTLSCAVPPKPGGICAAAH